MKDKKKIKVSVAIPVFNEQGSLKDFLERMLSQTINPDEIIFCDGGSTDRTVSILDGYKKKFTNIKLVNREGLCRGSGRNSAIEASSNELVALIDVGNVPETNWLELLIEELIRFPELEVVYGAVKPQQNNSITKSLSSFILGKKELNQLKGSEVPKKMATALERGQEDVAASFRELDESFIHEQQKINLDASGEGIVKAGDIEVNQNVEIINPDQYIATLSEGSRLKIEMTVEMGRGYVPTDAMDNVNKSIGEILIDAIFSPVIKVNYDITSARVDKRTDYEKLALEVWTNGTILPEDALAYSAKILKEQMTVFVNFDEEEIDAIPIVEETQEEITGSEDVLFTKVEDLEFSARSLNCLAKANIKYLGDLIQLTEDDLLNLENFGKRSLFEVRDVVAQFSLKLGEGINKDLYYQQRTKQEDTSQESDEVVE